MHCAGPFRPTLLLYCTHRCCITVLNTQVLYTCNTQVIAVPLYCKHKCCTSIWKRKKQMSRKRDTPWKDKSWIYHPFPQQSSRLSHPRRMVSSEPCQYKRWQDWKNTMHVVTNSEEIKKCHLVQVSKPSDSQCAAAWRYASNSALAACSTTLLRWSLWSTPSCDGTKTFAYSLNQNSEVEMTNLTYHPVVET